MFYLLQIATTPKYEPNRAQSETFLDLITSFQDFLSSDAGTFLVVTIFLIIAGLFIFYYGLYRVLPLILVVSLGAGLYLTLNNLGERTQTVTQAGRDEKPMNVRVEEVSGSRAEVVWETEKASTGFVLIGPEGERLERVVFEGDKLQEKKVHRVEVDQLEAGVTYYFTIVSGNEEYMNDGEPWSFTK